MSYTRVLHNQVLQQGARIAALIVIVAVSLLGIAPTYAFEDDSGAYTFEVAEVPQPQQVQAREPEANLPYLFAVFFVTWMAFFAYVFAVSRRQKEVRREIEYLRRDMADRDRERAPHVSGPGSQTP